MRRLTDIVPENLAPEQRRVWDAIMAGPRGAVQGPLRVWLRSPELADRAQQLGAFCRFGSSLPRRLSELAILVTAAHWQAAFEWWAHAPMGVEAGLAPAAVEAIRKGEGPRFTDPDEEAVHAFARELVGSRRVSEATYRRTVDLIGEKAVVELVGILGYYALVSMTIVAFGVALPPGESDPFEDRPPLA